MIVLAAACGAPPPPAAPARPTDDDVLVHAWKVSAHVLGAAATVSDADADGFTGRAIAITTAGYATPWHGTCETATRERRDKTLAEVAAALHVDRERLAALGLGSAVVEFRLACADNARAPELTLWIAGERALTCYAGACYVLAR